MAAGPDFVARIKPGGDPVADAAAVVQAGRARFTVLTPRLLRLEWAADGVFEDRATLAALHRRLPVPRFEVRTGDDGTTVVDTGALLLQHRPSDEPFGPDNLGIRVRADGREVHWRAGSVDPGNLRGTRRTLDNTGGPVALGEGLVSRSGWAVLDDSDTVVLRPDDGWATGRPVGERRDWYFFGHGHDYRGALADYVRIGGPIPLVPRYVLGVWWSRYWAYDEKSAAAVVDGFREHGLPLDVLVLDMDWHRPGWTGYSWNTELFPDPPGFLHWAHEQGLHVTLNLHPADGVHPHEDAYAAVAAALGHPAEAGEPIPFRAADPAFMRAYFEQLHHPLEDDGVDFWWMDWQQGTTTELAGLDPLPWLNHLHFADASRRPGRPLVFSRWGGAGGHRYPVGFSGDTFPTWQALSFQPEMTATGANVGAAWWSHDIGGHFGAVDPELYVRWIQAGALSPVLRLHSNDDPAAERRPWAFGDDILAACRAAIRLRYELLPYLYTYARVAADTGLALCRPMYFDHPAADAAYHAPGQYQLGDQLIAAPITSPANPTTSPTTPARSTASSASSPAASSPAAPGTASTDTASTDTASADTGSDARVAVVDVWIPEGVWADLTTGERHHGPRWIRITGGLDRIPLFARAGSILPLAALPVDTLPAHLGDIPADRLVLRVIAGERGAFRLYEDDGQTGDGRPDDGRPDDDHPDDDHPEGDRPSSGDLGESQPSNNQPSNNQPDNNQPGSDSDTRTDTHGDSDTRTDTRSGNGRNSGGHEWTDLSYRLLGDGRSEIRIGAVEGRCASLPDGREYVIELDGADPVRGVEVDGQVHDQWRLDGRTGRTIITVPRRVKARTCTVTITHEPAAPAALVPAAPRRPILHVQPAARPEQARRSLATLIAGAPAGQPFDLTVTWTMDDASGRRDEVVRLTGLRDDQILACPYALTAMQPQRWSVRAEATWQGETTVVEHRSPILLPAAGRWAIDGHAPSRQEADALEHVGQPHLVSLYAVEEFGRHLFQGTAMQATFRTVVRSDRDRPVLIELTAYGPARLSLNGSSPAAAPDVPVERTEPLSTTWIRHVVKDPMAPDPERVLLRGDLRAGDNDLVVGSGSPSGNPWWEFSVVLRDPADGTVLTGIEYREP